MTQNNLIYSCKIIWSINYSNILNNPKSKKNKNKITSTKYNPQNKVDYFFIKKKYNFSTYNFIGLSNGAKQQTCLIKNTVVFEK
jgi:hypothetical protein